jgi:acyl dehydratase
MSDAEVDERLREATAYTFKDEDIAAAKARLGEVHVSNYREQVTQATHDSMRNFARGYGDDNPLYNDLYYGRTTRWGGQLAAPMVMHVMNRGLLGEPPPKRIPFRGIQVFVSGSSNTWYRPVREGDVLYKFGGPESFTEKKSEFAGRSFVSVGREVHVNQNAEIVAISRTTSVMAERKAARENKKNAAIEPAHYTSEEIARHDAIYAAEAPRGAEPRYWEDVEIGEALQPLAKGPLTVTDQIMFHAGGYGFHYKPGAGRVGYKNRQRIGAFYILNDQGVPDIAMRLHWDKEWAQANGNPMPYDYGVLRDCWLTHAVTDWMGDDGWIVASASTIRKFNYIGDLHVMRGEVTSKRIEGGDRVVDLSVRGVNQRGEITCSADFTVALPSREAGPIALREPPQDLQRKAVELMSEHRRREAALDEPLPFMSL